VTEQPFKFYTSVKVRFNETDLQGHVYFGDYYTYFDVGVEEYLAAIGYDYKTLLADKTDLLYVESHCIYKSSAKHQDVLRIYTRIGHLGRRSLRFEFEVRQEADDRIVATGHIVAVTATFQKNKIPARGAEPDNMPPIRSRIIAANGCSDAAFPRVQRFALVREREYILHGPAVEDPGEFPFTGARQGGISLLVQECHVHIPDPDKLSKKHQLVAIILMRARSGKR